MEKYSLSSIGIFLGLIGLSHLTGLTLAVDILLGMTPIFILSMLAITIAIVLKKYFDK